MSNLALALDCLEYHIRNDTPVFMWGPVGVGKSQGCHQVKERLGMNIFDLRANIREPVDLRGIPAREGNSTKWLVPDELPRADRDGERGILLLEELNTATTAMQTACLGLVLERKLGDYTLPPGWVPVATGNRVKDSKGATELPFALRNRFAHLFVEPDLDTWVSHATAKGVSPMTVAFVRFRPELLHVVPGQSVESLDITIPKDANAFPTPRSLELSAKYDDAPESIRHHLFASVLGEHVALQKEAFIKVFSNLPSLDAIIANPTTERVPDETKPDQLYAVVTGLARKANRKNLGAIFTYADRLPRDFGALVGVDAIRRDKALYGTNQWQNLVETGAYTDWAVKHADLVM